VGQLPIVRREGGSESYVFLKFPGTRRRREKLLNFQWPHVNEETNIAKLHTLEHANLQRTLSTLMYST